MPSWAAQSPTTQATEARASKVLRRDAAMAAEDGRGQERGGQGPTVALTASNQRPERPDNTQLTQQGESADWPTTTADSTEENLFHVLRDFSVR